MKVDLKKIKKELKNRGLFSFAQKIKKTEPRAEVYLVGGAVRDLIMARDTTDFDFVVRNVPIKKLEKILTKIGKVNFVGKTFGVFKLAIKNNPHDIDIALPRTDFAFNTGGRKDFKIKYNSKLKIEDDLSRRDFTINAIALKIKNENEKTKNTNKNLKITKLKNHQTNYELIDPYHGLKDLKKKVIKTVGESDDRFKEDYSRILRAIRIAVELNFSIEAKTWQAIKKSVKRLNDKRNNERIIPYEVLAKEILKSFLANPIKTFDLFDQAGVFKVLMPEIEAMKNCPQPKEFHSEGDVFEHTKIILTKLYSLSFKKEFNKEKPSLLLILAALFHDIGKPATLRTPLKHGVDRIRFDNHDAIGAKITEKIIERLKLTSPTAIGIDTRKLLWLIRSHMFLIHVQGKMNIVRKNTLEKYFFNQEMPSQDLLKLFFVDILASRPKNGKPFLKDYRALKKRIKKLAKNSKKKNILPPPILNGHEIMKILKMESSPQIGKIKEELRETQLNQKIKNKKEAKDFIEKKYGNRG